MPSLNRAIKSCVWCWRWFALKHCRSTATPDRFGLRSGAWMKQVWMTRASVQRGKRPHAIPVTCLVLFSTAVLLTGCSTSIPPSAWTVPNVTPPGNASRAHVITASWYGSGFSGRRTSSGETFNPNELTAASRSLPMGSRVRVTNLTNGREVVVRINDRGPFVKGRSLDLSHAAAQRIGLTRKGVGRVQIARADGMAVRQPPAAVSPASYAAMTTWPMPRSHIPLSHVPFHTQRRRRRSYRRIVSNPIGDWILSAFPHF